MKANHALKKEDQNKPTKRVVKRVIKKEKSKLLYDANLGEFIDFSDDDYMDDGMNFD